MPASNNSEDCFTNPEHTGLLSSSEDRWLDMRRKIWDQLEERKQLLSRRPPYKLIPNFKGSDIAGNSLMNMTIMRPAKVVLCDPDRVLADIRFNVLQEGKTLVVPSPRLKSGMLRRIVPANGASSTELKECARATSSKCGVTVEFDQQLHIDVVVLSSVVTSSSGRRIGRADLFAELEYVLLASLGMIDELTTVVTIVHDLQLMNLDEDQFGPHDVKVDYIVTPTQVIECKVGEKPSNVLWSALNPECIDVLPLLKVFRQRDWKAKKNVCFAGETVVVEQTSEYFAGSWESLKKGRQLAKGKNKRKKRNFQRISSAGSQRLESRSEDQIMYRDSLRDETKKLDNQGKSVSENDAVGRPCEKKMAQHRRRNGWKSTRGSSCSEDQMKENHLSESDTSTQPAEGKKTKFRRDQSQLPALYIGGLVRNLRTWELRRLVKDHEVRPLFIVRPPFVGYAFLHFKTFEEVQMAIDSLSQLCTSDEGIRVEVARRSASKYIYKGGENEENLSEESGSCKTEATL